MSTDRISPDAGWADPATLPRGPQGRCLCRQCGVEVPKGRRTFCGEACVDRWKLKTDPSYARSRVGKRDKGRCARCGLRCKDLEKGLDLLGQVLKRLGRPRLFSEIRRTLKSRGRWSFWDADHILPVAQGGGGCDLDNFQTLCVWCHREKTASAARRNHA